MLAEHHSANCCHVARRARSVFNLVIAPVPAEFLRAFLCPEKGRHRCGLRIHWYNTVITLLMKPQII